MNFFAIRSGGWLWLTAGMAACHGATLDIKAGLGNIVIERVVYSVGGSDVVQTSRAADVSDIGDSEVFVKSVTGTGAGELTFFNTGTAIVLNVNPLLAATSGVGVFNNGATTLSNAGLGPYSAAVAGASMDTDLRNFGFHDSVTPPADPAVPDLDLLFSKAVNPEDRFLVTERWGNSSFTLLALAADGQPYAGANALRLGGEGGPPFVGYQAHDWNTGYAAAGNFPSQAQALTLFSVARFFEGTGLAEAPVYGVRVFNPDQADVKILGISDNPFTDNPDNPLVPEPSSALLGLGGLLALALRRNR